MADELARWAVLLVPSAFSCSLSLISCIHFSLLGLEEYCLIYKFFDSQVPSVPTDKLVVHHYACCVLTHLHCNGHNLFLSSYFFRIGRIKKSSCSACRHFPRTPLISFCNDQLWTLSATCSLVTVCLEGLGSCLASGFHYLPSCPHPSEGVR